MTHRFSGTWDGRSTSLLFGIKCGRNGETLRTEVNQVQLGIIRLGVFKRERFHVQNKQSFNHNIETKQRQYY